MHPAWTKLHHARQRRARAGHDADLLGSALIAFHGALEDYLRAWIAAHPRIPPDDRIRATDPRQMQWHDLVYLIQHYGTLPVIVGSRSCAPITCGSSMRTAVYSAVPDVTSNPMRT